MAKDAKWYAGYVRSAYAQTAEEKQTYLEAADFIEALAAELEAVKRELEEEKAHHQHTLECAQQFEEDWLKMKRERDALMRDLSFECYDSPHACYICKHGQDGVTKCKRCLYEDECFEWRGLCEANGGAEDA